MGANILAIPKQLNNQLFVDWIEGELIDRLFWNQKPIKRQKMVQMGNSAEEGENPSQEEKTTMLVKDKEDGYEGESHYYYQYTTMLVKDKEDGYESESHY